MTIRTGGRAVAALMVALAASMAHASGGADARSPARAVEDRLSGHVTPRVQSEVMVFGSWHLAAFRDWLEPWHLEGTRALLERYAPTRIAVERMAPDEIALLAAHAPHDPEAQRTLEQFLGPMLPSAQTMREALGIDRVTAARRAAELLEEAGQAGFEPGPGWRGELVAHLLAAYEFDSAILQWSYLTAAERAAADGLPGDVREMLNARLQRDDEIVQLAMPLARTLGLQRLYPVDSHYDVVRTLAFPSGVVDEVYGGASEQTREEGTIARMLAKADAARDAGEDLLELFLDVNTHATQVDDNTQWVSWLAMDHPSGLDRLRYAMWEQRNHRMAGHVMEAAASTRPERVLFIVGFSHKAHVERALEPQLSVRLVQPGNYVQAPVPGGLHQDPD